MDINILTKFHEAWIKIVLSRVYSIKSWQTDASDVHTYDGRRRTSRYPKSSPCARSGELKYISVYMGMIKGKTVL